MGQHDNNQRQNIIAIIPARLFSTRLPNKLLLPLGDKPLILWTLEQAKKAKNISRIIVATDSREILRVVEASGNEAVLTSDQHQSGSDRIAELAEILPENSIIVNVQGDEPLISPLTIEKAVEAVLRDDSIEMATTCEPIDSIEDVLSSDVVKVITDKKGFALYFSRSPIPFPREAVKKYGSLENALRGDKHLLLLYRKHTGLYVYRREFLLRYTKLSQTNLEKTEMLEQLRALENGTKIKVVEVTESSIGVDTSEDFERIKAILQNRRNIIYREAAVADIPQVAGVHVESWQKSFRGIVPQDYLDKISVENRILQFHRGFEQKYFYKMFVAESPETGVVGFADFGRSHGENKSEANLYAIYFLPEFQRKGIGGSLLRLCQKEMLKHGFKSMSLDALEESPYRNFYEKMGGKLVGTGTHTLGDIEFKTVVYRWEDLTKND